MNDKWPVPQITFLFCLIWRLPPQRKAVGDSGTWNSGVSGNSGGVECRTERAGKQLLTKLSSAAESKR